MFLAPAPFLASGGPTSGFGVAGATTGASTIALTLRSFLTGATFASSAILFTSSCFRVHAFAHIPMRDQADLAAAGETKRVGLYKRVGDGSTLIQTPSDRSGQGLSAMASICW